MVRMREHIMADIVLALFTFRSVGTILNIGGSDSWVLNKLRAKSCKYAVLCRNANHPQVEGPEAHGSAFLVGRISDIVPSPEVGGRWLVRFSKYAVCNAGDQWEGRNPVQYWTTDDYDIDFDALDFHPMPEPSQENVPSAATKGLTIPEAKAGLSVFYGVDPSAIEITIRG